MNTALVIDAAAQIVADAHTSMNAKGYVSTDQVRAFLTRHTGRPVKGENVGDLLRAVFGEPVKGYFTVSSN